MTREERLVYCKVCKNRSFNTSLGIFSLYRASISMLIGLIFYSALIILLALVEPATIFQGIILKVIIISSLIYSFRVAREEEAKNRVLGADLLDQL